MAMTTQQRRARLIELRGTRSLQEIGDFVGVSAQAVSTWEKKGTVSRKNAAAYDEALGAGGEVLNMLGYAAPSGVGFTTIDKKLDRILELLESKPPKRRHGGGGDATPTSMPRPALRGPRRS